MGIKQTAVLVLLVVLSTLREEVAGNDDAIAIARADKEQLTCNSVTQSLFEGANIMTDGAVNVDLALQTYCKAMSELLDCVLRVAGSSSTESTEEKKQYNYVVLQYLLADNLAGICTHSPTNLRSLQQIVENSRFEHNTDETLVNYKKTHETEDLRCFTEVHRSCVEQFTVYQTSAASQTDFCKGVDDFVNCYQPKTRACAETEATEWFARIIMKFSQPLIEQYKAKNLCRVRDEM